MKFHFKKRSMGLTLVTFNRVLVRSTSRRVNTTTTPKMIYRGNCIIDRSCPCCCITNINIWNGHCIYSYYNNSSNHRFMYTKTQYNEKKKKTPVRESLITKFANDPTIARTPPSIINYLKSMKRKYPYYGDDPNINGTYGNLININNRNRNRYNRSYNEKGSSRQQQQSLSLLELQSQAEEEGVCKVLTDNNNNNNNNITDDIIQLQDGPSTINAITNNINNDNDSRNTVLVNDTSINTIENDTGSMNNSEPEAISSKKDKNNSTSSLRNRRKNKNKSNSNNNKLDTSTIVMMDQYESIIELYDILMNKNINNFRYPMDYNYARKVIYYTIHYNTQSLFNMSSSSSTTSVSSSSLNQSNNTYSTEDTINNTINTLNNSNDEDNITIPQPHIETTTSTATPISTTTDTDTSPTTTTTTTADNIIGCINSSFHLWERTVQEYFSFIENKNENDYNNNHNDEDNNKSPLFLWFYDINLFHKLLLKWKVVVTATTISSSSVSSNHILQPSNILSIMDTISKFNIVTSDNPVNQNSNTFIFPKDIVSYNIILQVLLLQYQKESLYTVPLNVEEFINTYIIRSTPNINTQQSDNIVQQQIETNQVSPTLDVSPIPNVKPNIYTYSLLLQAWSKSNHPMTPQKMDNILTMIQDQYWNEIQGNESDTDSNNSSDNDGDNLNTKSNNSNISVDDIITPHAIAIRYWTNQRNIDKVESIYEAMKKIDIYNSVIRSEMIYCYCNRAISITQPPLRQTYIEKAYDLFQQMFHSFQQKLNTNKSKNNTTGTVQNLNKEMKDDIKSIMLSGHSILNTFRKIIVPSTKKIINIDQDINEYDNLYITQGGSILQQIEQLEQLDPISVGKLRHTMLDIYANVNRLKDVERLFEKTCHAIDKFPYTILMKAYGRCNQPEKAEQVLQRMLRNDTHRNLVDITMINCAINAWVDCISSDAAITADRAYHIYRYIYDHPICATLKLRPNVETYTLLLQCMAKTGSIQTSTNSNSQPRQDKIFTSIGTKVDGLLNEIEHRYISGDSSCKPDVLLYNIAIQSCLNWKEYDQAESILRHMEHRMALHHKSKNESNSPSPQSVYPDIRTYSTFLNCYSKLGTNTGAEWTEQLHNHMRKLSQTINPLLKPTTHTYNMVLTGWALSGVSDTSDRIWKVYEQMVQVDRIELDIYNYTTLISFLSKSKSIDDLQRAIELLQIMQKFANHENQPKIHPDGRHYGMVLNSCVQMNDVDNAAYVMNMFIDAYLMNRCRNSDHPDRTIFNWVVRTWIERNELILASWFIFDTITAKKNRNVVSLLIGPDYDTTMKLYDAWMESQHVEKDKYLTKIKENVIPLFHTTSDQPRSLNAT